MRQRTERVRRSNSALRIQSDRDDSSHDRRSGSDEVDPPWPGYLVGGPWPTAADWHDDQTDYKTNETAINWNGALIYALARHESQFDPTAVSARGARGLMQIMPATAKGLAGSVSKDKLFDPAINLTLGQEYVRQLVNQPQIGDNLMLVLAAYNGGPNRVARWSANAPSARDPLLFMESIPQRETRNYIARVLPHYWAYRARLDKPLTSLHQLAEGKWPRLTMNDEITTKRADLSLDLKPLRVASSR
ncbi:MAG: transglycosylase SLT domain-containing protein [Alphaproteobacteria bacterium]|nr:transglycosylase SLT domain-containing protein [Alphaproteobacteria bacterium]